MLYNVRGFFCMKASCSYSKRFIAHSRTPCCLLAPISHFGQISCVKQNGVFNRWNRLIFLSEHGLMQKRQLSLVGSVFARHTSYSPRNRIGEDSKKQKQKNFMFASPIILSSSDMKKLIDLLQNEAKHQAESGRSLTESKKLRILTVLESVRVPDLLSSAKPKEIAFLVYYLGKLQFAVKDATVMRELWPVWLAASYRTYKKWSAKQFNMVFLGLANLQLKLPTDLFCDLCEVAIEHLNGEFDEQHLANIARSVNKLYENKCVDVVDIRCQESVLKVFHTCRDVSFSKLDKFTPQELCNLIYALPASAITQKWLLHWLIAINNITEFIPQHFANSIYKLGKIAEERKGIFADRSVKCNVESFLKSLAKDLDAKGKKFDAQNISNIAIGLNKLSLIRQFTKLICDTWHSLDIIFIRRTKELDPQALTNYANCRAKFDKTLDPLFFSALIEACDVKIKQCRFKQQAVVELIYAFDLWRLRDPCLSRWLTHIDVRKMHSGGLNILLMSLAKLDTLIPDVMWDCTAHLLKTDTDQGLFMIMYAVCSCYIREQLKGQMLSQLQSVVKRELANFDAERLPVTRRGQLQTYRFLFGDACFPSSVLEAMDNPQWMRQLAKDDRPLKSHFSRLAETVATRLRLLLSRINLYAIREKFIPETGCHVDFYLESNKDTKGFVVQVDGPSHYYIKADGTPLGDPSGLTTETAMNTFLLLRAGYRVIRVPFYVVDKGIEALDTFLEQELVNVLPMKSTRST